MRKVCPSGTVLDFDRLLAPWKIRRQKEKTEGTEVSEYSLHAGQEMKEQ